MRGLTLSIVASLLATSVAAQTYEPGPIPPQINGAPTAMTPLQLGDDSTAQVDLGFEFTYWGQTFTSAWVSSNGFVSFGTSANLCCNGQPLEQAPRNTIYGLWTDLVNYSGNPYYRRSQGSILFGWYATNEFGTNNQYTFEIGLFDDGKIQFNYANLAPFTYHLATAGITGPNAGDNILLFYGRDPSPMQNQSGILRWTGPVVTVDCNVTPMDPSCPPEAIAPIDFISSEPINTVIDAATADAAADTAEAIVASQPEPEQEIVEVEPEAQVETVSITEQVAELVSAERLTPDQVAALAAPAPDPASAFTQGPDAAFGPAAPDTTAFAPAAPDTAAFGAATGLAQVTTGTAQTATPSSAFTAAFDTAPSSSSATSAANTLEVLNTLSSPAPQMAMQVEQTQASSTMAEGQAETMAAIAAVPGFSAYTQVGLQDRPDFYAIRDIYRNRRIRDANFEMYRLTRTNSDKLQEMIDAQYRQ